MNHLQIIHSIGTTLVRYSEAKLQIERKGRMACADCGKRIHRGDRFKVLSVAHSDCMDPRAVGQVALPVGLGCPEPLRTMLEKEVEG